MITILNIAELRVRQAVVQQRHRAAAASPTGALIKRRHYEFAIIAQDGRLSNGFQFSASLQRDDS
jgi:hypothetical protein